MIEAQVEIKHATRRISWKCRVTRWRAGHSWVKAVAGTRDQRVSECPVPPSLWFWGHLHLLRLALSTQQGKQCSGVSDLTALPAGKHWLSYKILRKNTGLLHVISVTPWTNLYGQKSGFVIDKHNLKYILDKARSTKIIGTLGRQNILVANGNLFTQENFRYQPFW